jgi:uncharacterized protein YbjQ (UPF0145 family)
MNWVVTCNSCGSSYVYESGQGLPDLCQVCSEKGKKEAKKFLEKEKRRQAIVAFSLLGLPDRKINRTLGLVSHEEIIGVGLTRDLDPETFKGGMALAWAEKVKNAKDFSLRAIRDEALELGGNAILGVEFSYHVLGTHNDMMILLVSTRGTAVLLSA